MSIKNEYIKTIVTLLPENKKRFLKIVEKLELLAEATPVDKPIYFVPATYLGSDGYDERTIVAKLEEWGVLTAEPEELNYNLLIFTTLGKLREVKSLLGGYTSSSLDYVRNTHMEESCKDEIQLINKLLQICNEKTEQVLLMQPAHLARNHLDKAGFDHLETLRDLQIIYEVFSSFNPPLDLIDLKYVFTIEAKIDFTKLNERAEDLHDEVESLNSNVLGIEQQKKELLRRLEEKFKKYPQEQYEYSEKILGSYRPENSERPMGYSLLQPDKNRTDIKYQFMRAMRALEKDGHIIIKGVAIDFDAQPQPTEESIYRHKWSLGERSLEFYPAEHCKVTIRPKSKDRFVLTPLVKPIAKSAQPNWSDDFVWKGNEFVFGNYGSINFSSDNRRALFKTLSDARGNWIAIGKLKGNKDANYVRATIKQIEDRFIPELKKHVIIPSTQNDDLEPKPSQGAYRIKFTPST